MGILSASLSSSSVISRALQRFSNVAIDPLAVFMGFSCGVRLMDKNIGLASSYNRAQGKIKPLSIYRRQLPFFPWPSLSSVSPVGLRRGECVPLPTCPAHFSLQDARFRAFSGDVC